MSNKFGKILIPLAIVIAGLLVAGALIYINQGKTEKEALTSQQIGEMVINYINANKDTVAGGLTASLSSIAEEGEIYKIKLKIGEKEYDSYVTKDGKFLFPQAYDLSTTSSPSQTGENNETAEVPKKDKPDVKLFVMSYCPYGLQAQKMFLPVYELLKNKAEMGVYFVDYIMHEKQEIDENLRQYCIQKEEKEKYGDYLSCFVKDGDFEKCLSETNIDREKMGNCISETDKEFNVTALYNDKNAWLNGQFPKFNVHNDLNEQYGVGGSPTIVINDTVVDVSPRSPEKFKEIICQAFNSPPEECSQTLSSDSPTSGFGIGTESSGSSGGCGQ